MLVWLLSSHRVGFTKTHQHPTDGLVDDHSSIATGEAKVSNGTQEARREVAGATSIGGV